MTLVADFNSSVNVPFQRMRQALLDGALQEGVVGANDFKVVQRGAGANQSVDVGTGFAWVQIDTGTRNGMGHVTNDATANVTLTASNATNPRVDQIILRWNDSSIPTGSGNVPTLEVLTGTATAGATLDNRTGATALPNDCLRLADILVPATSTSVTTANIRDRRPWARGFYSRMQGSRSGTNYATTNTTNVVVDVNNLQARVECSGAPLRFQLSGVWSVTASTGLLEILEDGTPIPGFQQQTTSTVPGGLALNAVHLPAPGSHIYALAIRMLAAGTVTVQNQSSASGTAPIFLAVEDPRQNANNGTA